MYVYVHFYSSSIYDKSVLIHIIIAPFVYCNTEKICFISLNQIKSNFIYTPHFIPGGNTMRLTEGKKKIYDLPCILKGIMPF